MATDRTRNRKPCIDCGTTTGKFYVCGGKRASRCRECDNKNRAARMRGDEGSILFRVRCSVCAGLGHNARSHV